MVSKEALTFDDVLLEPNYSEVLPADSVIDTRLTSKINLKVPVMSSAMDTVTEHRMAIAMAQIGGIGIIHRNLSVEKQSEQVRKVKKYESGIVRNPVTVSPDVLLGDALKLMQKHGISGIPVVKGDGVLVGILTNRDVRFVEDKSKAVCELMTKENLITVREDVSSQEAKKLLQINRIEKLVVVDSHGICIGLLTAKDLEKIKAFPDASKDKDGCLLVGAAVGASVYDESRVRALVESGVDILVVDTAHGHSKNVLKTVSWIRSEFPDIGLIAGNVATVAGVKALVECGVDAVKVGIGPGSICTTRIVAGVGVPQFTAILDAVEAVAGTDCIVIADGGIKYSGDIVKALAAGAEMVMLGSLLAGTEEAPGEVFLYKGRGYKSYRGMGSVGAMARGSADRYFQRDVDEANLIEEGVEGRIPYKGAVSKVLQYLVGGLRAGMGYLGAKDLQSLRKNAKFVRISYSSLLESHTHGVDISKESPNYQKS